MPVDPPSSLSRTQTGGFLSDSKGLESILGKRKPELELPPANTKRHATTFPFSEEEPGPGSESPLSSSDLDECERVKDDQTAVPNRGSCST
jgi:hypothetical protein